MAALAALLLELVVYYLYPMNGLGRYLTFGLTSAVYFGWLVAHAARGFSGWIAVVFEHPVLRYVGRISYTLYLTHAFMPDLLQQPRITAAIGKLSLPMLAITSLVSSFVVATLSWFLLEKPLLRMAHAVSRSRASVGLASTT